MNATPAEFTQAWFEESSRCWMLNKKKRDNCTYVYVCSFKDCRGERYNKGDFCSLHTPREKLERAAKKKRIS